jgi:hypothetical protein
MTSKGKAAIAAIAIVIALYGILIVMFGLFVAHVVMALVWSCLVIAAFLEMFE